MIGTTGLFIKKLGNYTDYEVVEGLQRHDHKLEEWFYRSTRRYFNDCFHEVFFDMDRKQEIFQAAFLKLWTEIDNHRIRVINERVCRQQVSGEYKPMTCALTTFLMAFARTEYREVVRSTKEDNYGELFEDANHADVMITSFDKDEDIDELKNRIVDDCIQGMSPTCVEILTLFYYQEKSLDEIMEIRRDKNASKNGLKTAKNKCMNTLRERVTARFKSSKV